MLQFLWLVKMPICLLVTLQTSITHWRSLFSFQFFFLNQFRPLSQVTRRSNTSREVSKEGAEYALQLQY